jgi:hypothetical protein
MKFREDLTVAVGPASLLSGSEFSDLIVVSPGGTFPEVLCRP